MPELPSNLNETAEAKSGGFYFEVLSTINDANLKNAEEVFIREVKHLFPEHHFDVDEIFFMEMAFREVLVNSITYGNLKWKKPKGQEHVEGAERTKAIISWAASHRELAKVPVKVHLKRTGKNLEIRIIDQGEGFDSQEVADPTEESNILKTTGRGLLLVKEKLGLPKYTKTKEGFETEIRRKILE